MKALPPRGSWSLRLGASLLIAALPLVTACASKNTAPPATPSEADGFASFGPGGLDPGAHVQINRNSQWLPGAIVRQLGPNRYQVHYDGFGAEWDEAVGLDRLRPGAEAGAAGTVAKDYRPGEKILVRAQNRLLLADVVQQVSPEVWRVHYDGYGPEVAESVPAPRMRRQHAGTSAFGASQPVTVDVGGGRVLPGKVIGIVAADRWLVRFDGFGPEYDQEVGADRVHAGKATDAPPAPAPTAGGPATPPTPAEPDKGKGKDKGKDKGKGKDKPAEPAPPAPPPVTAGPPAVGDSVVVAQHLGYLPAKIVAAGSAPGTFRVHYELGTGADEDVAADRVAKLLDPPKGVPYAPNTPCFIEWHGAWFPGKVVKESAKGQYRVRFEGLGPEADEVLVSKRIRPR